ncbi:hypothetical protein B0T19DRAFT_413354 [Cercophora scortea]|uniref:Uncharacterized protein n=1 Tax=Cercophora scortea TaxID=314031 RepID=A0AAE0MN20_9PEZI|nr:hypothetical protein B0T19DRAFT_413354 [Cercophora scortea]
MAAAGGFSCFVRWVCHIPTGYLAFNGIGLYNTAKGVADLDAFPNGSVFRHGLLLVGATSVITFVWNFIMFGASPFARGGWLGMVGVVDTIFGCILVLGIVFQNKFLPGTYGGCGFAAAADYGTGPGHRNFYIDAAGTGDPAGTELGRPHELCISMMQSWAVTIAVAALYLFCALLEMGFGFANAECCNGALTDALITLLIILVYPFIWTYKGLRWIWRFISAAAPTKCFRKRTRPDIVVLETVVIGDTGSEASTVLGADEKLKEKTEAVAPVSSAAQVLMAKKLHFADLVKMGLSPGDLGDASVVDLGQFTCLEETRGKCGICGMQICKGCANQIQLSRTESPAHFHMRKCQAYCRPCYVTLRSERGEPEAECPPASLFPPCVLDHANDDRFEAEEREGRDICRICAVKRAYDSCHLCEVEFPDFGGARWWVCPSCDREADSSGSDGDTVTNA